MDVSEVKRLALKSALKTGPLTIFALGPLNNVTAALAGDRTSELIPVSWTVSGVS